MFTQYTTQPVTMHVLTVCWTLTTLLSVHGVHGRYFWPFPQDWTWFYAGGPLDAADKETPSPPGHSTATPASKLSAEQDGHVNKDHEDTAAWISVTSGDGADLPFPAKPFVKFPSTDSTAKHSLKRAHRPVRLARLHKNKRVKTPLKSKGVKKPSKLKQSSLVKKNIDRVGSGLLKRPFRGHEAVKVAPAKQVFSSQSVRHHDDKQRAMELVLKGLDEVGAEMTESLSQDTVTLDVITTGLRDLKNSLGNGDPGKAVDVDLMRRGVDALGKGLLKRRLDTSAMKLIKQAMDMMESESGEKDVSGVQAEMMNLILKGLAQLATALNKHGLDTEGIRLIQDGINIFEKLPVLRTEDYNFKQKTKPQDDKKRLFGGVEFHHKGSTSDEKKLSRKEILKKKMSALERRYTVTSGKEKTFDNDDAKKMKKSFDETGSELMKKGFDQVGSGLIKKGFDQVGSELMKKGFDQVGLGLMKKGFDQVGSGLIKKGFDQVGSGLIKKGFDQVGSGLMKKGFDRVGSGFMKKSFDLSGTDTPSGPWKKKSHRDDDQASKKTPGDLDSGLRKKSFDYVASGLMKKTLRKSQDNSKLKIN